MSSASKFEDRRRARRRALQALYQWHMTDQAPSAILLQFHEEQDFSNVDNQLFTTLVTKIAASQDEINEKITPFLDRPVSQLDVIEHIILSIATYEIVNDPAMPYQVVIDEAVNLAKQFGAEQGHSFINGVLDKAARVWRDPATFSPFNPA